MIVNAISALQLAGDGDTIGHPPPDLQRGAGQRQVSADAPVGSRWLITYQWLVGNYPNSSLLYGSHPNQFAGDSSADLR